MPDKTTDPTATEETVSEAPPARVFTYNDQSWDDPGPEYSNDDVRKHLAGFFPELANAEAQIRDLDDGRQEVKFVKRAGTKANTQYPISNTHLERAQ